MNIEHCPGSLASLPDRQYFSVEEREFCVGQHLQINMLQRQEND